MYKGTGRGMTRKEAGRLQLKGDEVEIKTVEASRREDEMPN